MAVIVLDAGVLIGYLDRDDSHHARSVTVMNESAGEELHLPASAYAEVMVGAYRAGLADGVRERIDELELLIDPVDRAMADAAARLRATHRSLRLPDALLLATAQQVDGEVITTDRVLGRIDPARVRVLA
ncbi:MAG: PIN domain-containing protein [Candidatus Limnocylindrales bacterium]|nr:PIN domain-containing protein [Chloroflexota bacterium]